MKTQINLVIQSINNARQTLGRKSDIDHVHEDQEEDLERIVVDVTGVRSNISSLMNEIAEIKTLTKNYQLNESYLRILEEVCS